MVINKKFPPLYVLSKKETTSRDQFLMKSQQPDVIKVKIDDGSWM